jgi:hypothetical protein
MQYSPKRKGKDDEKPLSKIETRHDNKKIAASV